MSVVKRSIAAAAVVTERIPDFFWFKFYFILLVFTLPLSFGGYLLFQIIYEFIEHNRSWSRLL